MAKKPENRPKQAPKKRGPRGPNSTSWKPGGPSPNPGGRPSGFKEFTEMHRELVPDAKAKLLEQLDHKDPYIVQGAIKIIYERGFGKAAQPITGEGGEGPAQVGLLDNELLGYLKKLAEKPPAQVGVGVQVLNQSAPPLAQPEAPAALEAPAECGARYEELDMRAVCREPAGHDGPHIYKAENT